MSERGLLELSKKGLLDNQATCSIEFYEYCSLGKQRINFDAAIHRTKSTLDYFHSDLWGPSKESSIGGSKYLLTIIDD